MFFIIIVVVVVVVVVNVVIAIVLVDMQMHLLKLHMHICYCMFFNDVLIDPFSLRPTLECLFFMLIFLPSSVA